MLKVGIYFFDTDKSKAVYLPGISKRLSALGFQPAIHDRFKIEDLNTKDQQLVTEVCSSSIDTIEVLDRDFIFGIKFSELNVYLGIAHRDNNRSSHEMFNGRTQLGKG